MSGLPAVPLSLCYVPVSVDVPVSVIRGILAASFPAARRQAGRLPDNV